MGGTVGVSGLGSARAAAGSAADERCPEATVEPSVVPYDDSLHEVCADDDPATASLQADVRRSLESTLPTVGSLLDAGFVPYFDFFTEGTVSHWLDPESLGDDSVMDPDRPASVLVDHTWWRPIGVMFVATREGEPVDPPPTVYADGDGGDCAPWHAHVGLPSRYAWWKYRAVYQGDWEFPCRTPWMMHVWRYPHQENVYAHAPPEDRGGPPAEPPGFETDADPDEVDLRPEHLSDALLAEVEELWGRSA
ncbi:MAG: hypothetical protein ABEJ06_02065 [Haloarculaceae archaeon]